MSVTSIYSISDVIERMSLLQSTLIKNQYPHLRYFNRTYQLITQAVARQITECKFQENKLMEQFDLQFALYYFNALENHRDKLKVPAAWQICFEYCKRADALPTIAMALGVNAHVNNDLPQTLVQCELGDAYINDYRKVNTIIGSNLECILSELNDSHKYCCVFSTTGISTKLILPRIIKRWREMAWNLSKQLQEGTTDIANIERSAEVKAKYLILLR